MVPVRAIFEALGAVVNWDDDTTVTPKDVYTVPYEKLATSTEFSFCGIFT